MTERSAAMPSRPQTPLDECYDAAMNRCIASWGSRPNNALEYRTVALAALKAERERSVQLAWNGATIVRDKPNTTALEEQIARAILKCAINDVGREYPDWENASHQNREIALKCARAAIGRIYAEGFQILPTGVVAAMSDRPQTTELGNLGLSERWHAESTAARPHAGEMLTYLRGLLVDPSHPVIRRCAQKLIDEIEKLIDEIEKSAHEEEWVEKMFEGIPPAGRGDA